MKNWDCIWSHLLQMRGLKPKLMILMSMSISVASFTDAWIETDNAIKMSGLEVSHLLQMRGLKLRDEKKYKPFMRRIFYRCVD